MKAINRITGAILGLGLASCLVHAQNVIDWKGTTGDFFDANNWEGGVVPGVGDVAEINNGGTATIGQNAGAFALAGIRLGSVQDGTESGHVIMNGGTLNLSANPGDPKAVIGFSSVLSTFVQNGGTIFFDGPDQFPGQNKAGVNELDWEVGEKGTGRFEMHGGVFRGSDDLKVAENALGNGYAIIDGSAVFSTGSGISVGGGGLGVLEEMVIAGNALVESGNSMGAGNPLGMSDEGYLTMSSGGSNSKLTIKENGVLNIRRLTSREGISYLEVMDHGQFHIFDVLNGKGYIDANTPPDRPAETGPNSTYASAPSDATLILRDDAVMTVNSAQGLGISAPRDPGNAGGTARMFVRDRASFRVEQDLKVGTGAAASSIGLVEVAGPNAKVSVGGNLLLAYNADLPEATPGQGTLSVMLTGPTQAPVEITGTAYLGNGTLKISTTNFLPGLDSTFRVLTAAAIDGTFKVVDTSDAKLASGLAFAVIYNADSVDIKVVSGPGRAEDNGVNSKTATIFLNPPDLQNNGNTESLGVAIASNGNVLASWEDDKQDADANILDDNEAAWLLFGPDGTLLTQPVEITAQFADIAGQTITSPYRSFFRADQSPAPHYTSWGPKIKANPFGPGLGMGATSFALHYEIPEMAPMADADENDFPSVQLLTDSGAPVKIVSWSAADTAPTGAIRIGDWEYLADGNILIVGSDRQAEEQTRLGAPATQQPVFKIVTQANDEVKGLTLASSTTDTSNNDMWNGAAVSEGGFAIRAARSLRFFHTDGTPYGDDVDVAAATGDPVYMKFGDRGGSLGFHGNGKDAYVMCVSGADAAGTNGVFVSVWNTNGTLRWATNATVGMTLNAPGATDAAMDASGRVFVVFDDTTPSQDGTKRTVVGRLLDNTGHAVSAAFLIDPTENPQGTTVGAANPRVAWRGDTVAVVWETENKFPVSPDPVNAIPPVGAMRFFTVPSGSGDITASVSASGGNITITWTGGAGPFTIQKKTTLTDASWTTAGTTSERTITLPASGNTGFFRVVQGL